MFRKPPKMTSSVSLSVSSSLGDVDIVMSPSTVYFRQLGALQHFVYCGNIVSLIGQLSEMKGELDRLVRRIEDRGEV